MASISQGIALTTAMLVSSTVLYLAFSKHSFHHNSTKQILRSCLYSGEKKRNKKKRVKFSENVMVKEIREENREEEEEKKNQNRVRKERRRNCRNEKDEMPANRIALYNGILRDRGNRIASCH
ncbi:hypothetical protein PIB30_033403 [Stylosanthes scabra]|uniref:Transmembrane protein n=1 Tax=Stylosanthes scabra TaxID=79078 RepID=A0ABU6RDB8_9FABA|nr:hypothetical protein [Stylosanthes scabra]